MDKNVFLKTAERFKIQNRIILMDVVIEVNIVK
jgi:hypothetical protein